MHKKSCDSLFGETLYSARWHDLVRPLLQLSLGVLLALSPWLFTACSTLEPSSLAQPKDHPEQDPKETQNQRLKTDEKEWYRRGGIRLAFELPLSFPTAQLPAYIIRRAFGITDTQAAELRLKDPAFPRVQLLQGTARTHYVLVNVDPSYYRSILLVKHHLPPNEPEAALVERRAWFQTLPSGQQATLRYAAERIAIHRGAIHGMDDALRVFQAMVEDEVILVTTRGQSLPSQEEAQYLAPPKVSVSTKKKKNHIQAGMAEEGAGTDSKENADSKSGPLQRAAATPSLASTPAGATPNEGTDSPALPQTLSDEEVRDAALDDAWHKAALSDWQAFHALKEDQQRRLLGTFALTAELSHLRYMATHPLKLLSGMTSDEVDEAIARTYQAAKNPTYSPSERLGHSFRGHALFAGKLSFVMLGVGSVFALATLVFATPAVAIAGLVITGKTVLSMMVTGLLFSGASTYAYEEACLTAKSEQEAKRNCFHAAEEAAGLTANVILLGLTEATVSLVKLPKVQVALSHAYQRLRTVTSPRAYLVWLGVEPDLILTTYRESVRRYLQEAFPASERAVVLSLKSGQELVAKLTDAKSPLSLTTKLSREQLADLTRLAARPEGRATLDATLAQVKEQLEKVPRTREALALARVREVEQQVTALKRAPSKEAAQQALDRLAHLDAEPSSMLQAELSNQLNQAAEAKEQAAAAGAKDARMSAGGSAGGGGTGPAVGAATGAKELPTSSREPVPNMQEVSPSEATASERATKGETNTRYGPMNPGPLPETIANTFQGGSYVTKTLGESTILYRVYGGSASKTGNYWTRIKPAGPLQSQIDLALRPEWGNTASQVTTIRVPAGTIIYEGVAAKQGGLVGGGNQIYLPTVDPKWVLP